MTVTAINWGQGETQPSPAAETHSKATTGGHQHAGEPVEVYRALNELEAHVIKGFLESNDIPVMLRQESLGGTLGISIGMLAEVRVYVPEPLAPRALELLEAQSEDADQAPEAASDEQQD